jgi:hypothetical protein
MNDFSFSGLFGEEKPTTPGTTPKRPSKRSTSTTRKQVLIRNFDVNSDRLVISTFTLPLTLTF